MLRDNIKASIAYAISHFQLFYSLFPLLSVLHSSCVTATSFPSAFHIIPLPLFLCLFFSWLLKVFLDSYFCILNLLPAGQNLASQHYPKSTFTKLRPLISLHFFYATGLFSVQKIISLSLSVQLVLGPTW